MGPERGPDPKTNQIPLQCERENTIGIVQYATVLTGAHQANVILALQIGLVTALRVYMYELRYIMIFGFPQVKQILKYGPEELNAWATRYL